MRQARPRFLCLGALRSERGTSLLLALVILLVFSIVGGMVVKFSSTNTRSAEISKDRTSARSLAEGGVAHAMSILNQAPDPTVQGLLPARTVGMNGGTVTYSGKLDAGSWTITATGALPNPSGAADIQQTVTAVADVRGVVPGASPEFWNRLYHDSTTTCFTIEEVEIPVPIASRGDLCLEGNVRVTGATTTVEVGGDVTLENPARVGNNGLELAEVHVAGTCEWQPHAANRPCGPADKVYAATTTTNPEHLVRPALDLPYWYEHAAPGPMHGCDVGSFPHGFDNDGTYNNSRPGGTSTDSNGRRNAEITYTDLSYTCQALDGDGNIIGEISWNHLSHVLKISGSVFIDGDVRFDDDGQLVNYQGRGIIFSAGDVEYDEVVCAGGDGTYDCHSGDMSGWDPNDNMLILLSGGDSEYDQGKTSPRQPAALQGVLYAQGDCLIHQDFKLSGPVICDTISLPFNEAWPSFYSWPPLNELIDAQIYGSKSSGSDGEVTLIGIYG